MSTEQEISGAEREAILRAEKLENFLSATSDIEAGWLAARDYYKAQLLEQNGKLGAATAAIQRERDESEVACAEQRERADMAEEREKALQGKIDGVVAALIYLAPDLDDLAVALLQLGVRCSDLIPAIEKTLGILGDTDVP